MRLQGQYHFMRDISVRTTRLEGGIGGKDGPTEKKNFTGVWQELDLIGWQKDLEFW